MPAGSAILMAHSVAQIKRISCQPPAGGGQNGGGLFFMDTNKRLSYLHKKERPEWWAAKGGKSMTGTVVWLPRV